MKFLVTPSLVLRYNYIIESYTKSTIQSSIKEKITTAAFEITLHTLLHFLHLLHLLHLLFNPLVLTGRLCPAVSSTISASFPSTAASWRESCIWG